MLPRAVLLSNVFHPQKPTQLLPRPWFSSCSAAVRRIFTREVQRALDQFTANAGRAGRLRGEFVDAGDESVLQRQAAAVVGVRRALAVIQQLTADNVNQQQGYRMLAELTERRIALMDRAVELRRSGRSRREDQIAIARQITPLVDESDEIIRSMARPERRIVLAGESPVRVSAGAPGS